VFTSLVAALALNSLGCVVTPLQSDRPESAPLASTPNDTKAREADQAGVSGLNTTFQEKATFRQRFQVHIDFGRLFENQGNLDAAIQEYQDALTVVENKRHGPFRPSDEALAHRRIGGALDRLGRFAQAETHYKKALKLSPKDPKIWNDAGYSFYLQGRWADAERALKTAMKLAPDDERVRVNLGLTMAAQGRTDLALSLLSRIGGDAIGHANLGYLLAASGQFDLARSQYEQALAMRPDLQLARRALARIELQERNLQSPGASPTLVAQGTGSTAHPVDPGVNQASTASVKIPPPLPWRTRFEARAASVGDRPASASPSSIPDPTTMPPPPPL